MLFLSEAHGMLYHQELLWCELSQLPVFQLTPPFQSWPQSVVFWQFQLFDGSQLLLPPLLGVHTGAGVQAGGWWHTGGGGGW
jgi:hypothetical protein